MGIKGFGMQTSLTLACMWLILTYEGHNSVKVSNVYRSNRIVLLGGFKCNHKYYGSGMLFDHSVTVVMY
jgi:hypothetical protein